MREVYHDPRDGEVMCSRCQKRLNRTDRLCWSCGSEKLDIIGHELKSLMAVREIEPPRVDADYMRRMVKGAWGGSGGGQSGGTSGPVTAAGVPLGAGGAAFVPPPGYPAGATRGMVPGATTNHGGKPYAGQMKLISCTHGLNQCPACKRLKCSDVGYCQPCWQKQQVGYLANCPAADPDNVIQP